MPSRFACSIAFLVLVWCSTGCRTVRHDVNRGLTTNGEPVRVDHEAAEKRAEAHAQFMAGLSYDQSGEPERATAAYEKSLSNDPANEGLAVDLSRRYLQQKQYDKAIEVLKRAAESAQGSGLMFARLSLVYLQQGNTNAAIEASRAAIKREPSSIAGYQSLFHLHRALNQTNEAQKVIEQAAKQPKPDAPFLIDLAQMYLALDAESPLATNSPSRLRASELLKRASSMENTNLLSLQRLAQGFLFVGESKRAAEVYRKMLAEDPELVGVREALAELYLRSNDTKQAGEILKEIVRDTPTNPQAYYFLGAIAYEERRFEDALDNYRKALLLGMDREQIYFDISAANLALNKPREALDWLGKAERRFRQSFLGSFYSGIAYMRLKEYTNAIDKFVAAEVIARATDTNRLTHHLYFELGAAHERAGKIPDAERYFEKCLKMQPNFSEALNYLGYMWAERSTNLLRAREMIEKAVSLQPTNAAYLDSLGWVLFKQGHTKEALKPIRKAIEFSEEPDATLFDHLGDIYAALKQLDKAREAWRKSLEIEPNKEVEKKLKAEASPPGESTRK